MHTRISTSTSSLGLLVLLLVFAGPANAQSPFGAPQLLLDGRLEVDYPRVLAYADLDGDGDLDAYGSPLTEYRSYTLENLGGGQFAQLEPLPRWPGSGVVWSMTHADLNGDGLQDLLFGTALSGAYYRLQSTGMVFGPAVGVPMPIDNVRFLKAVDLDADGDRDLLAGGYNGSDFMIYRLDQTGPLSFAAPLLVDAPIDAVQGWLIEDIDTDGYPELFAHSAYRDKVWWYPNRSGLLDAAFPLIDSLDYPQGLAVADTDGDGAMELLITTAFDQTIRRMAYLGADAFAVPEGLPSPVSGEAILPGDADGDGDVDLMLHDDDEVVLMRNDGFGGFSAEPRWEDNSYRRLGQWADADGNGTLDWLDATNGRLAWCSGDGSGGFGSWTVLSLPEPAELAFGDLDGDGRMDMVNGGASLTWMPVEADGTVRPAQWIADYDRGEPLLFDADGDGDLDLVTLTIDYVRLHRNAAGAFGEADTLYDTWASYALLGDAMPEMIVPASDGPEEEAPYAEQGYAEDLDGDGDLDLILLLGEYDTLPPYLGGLPFFERIVALWNDGSGNFPIKSILADTTYPYLDYALADLDADNDIDLVLEDGRGLWVALNDGSGVFAERQAVERYTYSYQPSFALGDLTGDGLPDLVQGDEGLHWRRNIGGGVFGREQAFAEPCYGDCTPYVADWDQDQDADLLLFHQNRYAWYPQQGPGTPVPERQNLNIVDGSVESAYAADLDQDGAMDLISLEGEYSEKRLYWYRSNPNACGIPQNLRDTLLNDSTRQLAWDPVPAAQGYRIRIGDPDHSWQKRLETRDHRLEVMTANAPSRLAWSVRTACPEHASAYAPKRVLEDPVWRLPAKAASDQVLPAPWPNPVSHRLVVEAQGAVRLLDALGQIRWAGYGNGMLMLDLSTLPSGHYLLERAFDGGWQRDAVLKP